MTTPHRRKRGTAKPVPDAPETVQCPSCKRQHERHPQLGQFCSNPCLTQALTERWQQPERSQHHAT